MTDLPGTPMPPPSSGAVPSSSPSTPPVPGPMPPPGGPPRVPSGGDGDTSGSSMKDRAGGAAQAAKQGGSDVASTATDKAKDVAQEAKRQARDLAGEARDQLSGRIGDQQHNLVSNVRSLAQELEAMARGEISPNGSDGVAHELVSQAGDRARSVADWLDGREPGELLDELRSFARRRPGTFLIGATLAGVVAGRLTRGVVASHTEDSSSGQLRSPAMYRTDQTTPLVGYGVPPTGVSDPGMPPTGTMGEEYVVGSQRDVFPESGLPGSRPYDGGQP
jgi:hypothetical protein